ncbi:unnamed protein product [Caenorhabditis bovis]|uniref:Uncharacterized protein n=1 Tax=Caenorhabditis bovis TaxID=2654633 RepID=A0A8S1EBA0_9PELO|nr:unnamed protein product [Caenorhabditis bovis]
MSRETVRKLEKLRLNDEHVEKLAITKKIQNELNAASDEKQLSYYRKTLEAAQQVEKELVENGTNRIIMIRKETDENTNSAIKEMREQSQKEIAVMKETAEGSTAVLKETKDGLEKLISKSQKEFVELGAQNRKDEKEAKEANAKKIESEEIRKMGIEKQSNTEIMGLKKEQLVAEKQNAQKYREEHEKLTNDKVASYREVAIQRNEMTTAFIGHAVTNIKARKIAEVNSEIQKIRANVEAVTRALPTIKERFSKMANSEADRTLDFQFARNELNILNSSINGFSSLISNVKLKLSRCSSLAESQTLHAQLNALSAAIKGDYYKLYSQISAHISKREIADENTLNGFEMAVHSICTLANDCQFCQEINMEDHVQQNTLSIKASPSSSA